MFYELAGEFDAFWKKKKNPMSSFPMMPAQNMAPITLCWH